MLHLSEMPAMQLLMAILLVKSYNPTAFKANAIKKTEKSALQMAATKKEQGTVFRGSENSRTRIQ